MTHKDLFRIANALLGGENLKAQKGAIARELKILQSLTKGGRYDDPLFWDDLHLGFQLSSLCWFKTEEGRNVLEREWRLFQFQRAESDRIAAIQLDSILNSDTLSGDSPQVDEPPPVLPRKQSPVEWCDSE